ncbi:carbon-nitrogen hydrolase family protein [Marinivivus vitaminiproducens]|uniref:carbon-nitrogen hydrolase family protein n=1 Tax=Marinivivus vitaminiproducens TaxID=3035935 RepID=UPI00279A9047|nr:carbon-nitrogen hydrolase family protein [Geminicoccaceae bacterium SCSIO 64248]
MNGSATDGLRIALFQGPATAGDVPAFLSVLDRRAAEAAGRGAVLLMLPEMALTGYNIGAPAVRRAAVAQDHATIEAIRAIARRHRIALLLGYPERATVERVHNAAILIGRDGAILANYRKQHLFGSVDRDAFAAGDADSIIRLGPFTAGILICYDIEFPEAVRALALKGVDLLLVPTALMRPYEIVPRLMVPTRAYENGIFVAYCNRAGVEDDFAYTGESCVVAPDGSILARAGSGEEMILADLDPAAIAEARALAPYLDERRPEIYGPLSGVIER